MHNIDPRARELEGFNMQFRDDPTVDQKQYEYTGILYKTKEATVLHITKWA